MAFDIGTRLGVYELLGPLGSGGMGDVYQATDTKLGRNVAIKLLPAAFASDFERLTRFRREAQALAALNHLNIAQIYGIEDSGGTSCIVNGMRISPQASREPPESRCRPATPRSSRVRDRAAWR